MTGPPPTPRSEGEIRSLLVHAHILPMLGALDRPIESISGLELAHLIADAVLPFMAERQSAVLAVLATHIQQRRDDMEKRLYDWRLTPEQNHRAEAAIPELEWLLALLRDTTPQDTP